MPTGRGAATPELIKRHNNREIILVAFFFIFTALLIDTFSITEMTRNLVILLTLSYRFTSAIAETST